MNFQDESHALHTGMVAGALMRCQDVAVEPVLDEDDNYTSRLKLTLGIGYDDVEVTIEVLP